MKTQIPVRSLRAFAANQIRANSCNSCLLPVFFAFFAFSAVNCAASTNDLASALQKGLFEEEANHNFPAAIEAYQGVINRFDEDRKLAATAIFRVGEIYRKQGKTNEANTQYERVVREFSDQSTLATLSQSYLAPVSKNLGTAAATPDSAPTSDEAEEVKKIRAMIRDSPDLINARDQGGNTRLHTAAFQGHLVVARFLIENGADANAQNRSGWTPLHDAVNGGHKALVELCLSHSASVQTPDSNGNTPLHIAARRGFRSIVEVLLAHAADANAKTKSGSTPLHLAAANGFRSVAELLWTPTDINAASDDVRDLQEQTFKGTALHIAVSRGDGPLAELLLANKANPNATNNVGDTPLHVAAQLTDPKLIELLLANKAAVDPLNNNGETPLDLSAKSGVGSAAMVLLAHGADVNARNPLERGWKGWTPLLYAVNSRHTDTAALLLKHNANPNIKSENQNSKGLSPLFLAASAGDAELVASLLDAKADPNIKDDWGSSPALAAIRLTANSPYKRILSLLLDHGADAETTDSDGKTLLIIAVERADKELVELLLAHKADVNAQTPFGSTPLHFLVSSYNQRSYESVSAIAELLFSAGANVNLQNKDGKTPLNLLLSSQQQLGQRDIRSKIDALLRSHGALMNPPRLDAIEALRSDSNFSKVIFTKGTNGYDQFTLFDLIGVQYKLLSASPDRSLGPGGDSRSWSSPYSRFAGGSGLDFPDFTRVRIRHPKPDFKGWNERTVNIAAALTSGDCSADVPLEAGDQVEIPEADHVLNATWEGLSEEILASLKKCLTRRISIVIKGQSTIATLAPDLKIVEHFPDQFGRSVDFHGKTTLEVFDLLSYAPFMIRPVLLNSKLLLASSDLSRIKLIRADPASGQKRELIVDCSNSAPAPSVWLRDGDIIEVPDKP
jgi:ankyrin repeat protein